jgi:pilus assembly protein Flp/PilA
VIARTPWGPGPAVRGFGPNCNKELIMLFAKIKQFLVSEDGPTAVEYAVMLALIIVVCLVAIQSLGSNTSTTFTNISNSLGS